MDFKCKACGRLIFNRRLAACEFCNAPIPKELLYTEEERRRLDREVKDEIHRQMVELQKEQNRGRDAEDEEEEKEEKRSDPGIEQLLALAAAQDKPNGGGKK